MSPTDEKMRSSPMVYISGEEMSHYTMKLILEKWIYPNCDTSKWEYFDLSCKNRDDTEDQVLRDAVQAGKKIGAIFKEPTITPTEIQKKALGLKKTWGSPNGAMRAGWNGITISRDTIMIEGMDLGFKRPVFFERHAIGGEYGAGHGTVGRGYLKTIFTPEAALGPTDAYKGQPLPDELRSVIIDERRLVDDKNAVVTYSNPLDNVEDLAHIFFTRCLKAKITPYVVTKKTVFKWQEGFWVKMKEVYDRDFKQAFVKAGIMKGEGELQHLISDAATMNIIRWTDGGFGMACHNYDGDMLTDEVAQVHRSPGFITSNLVGKSDCGKHLIKEFEASHGTVADMWQDHLRGKETSMNPLGMVEALIGAMQHSAELDKANNPDSAKIVDFTNQIRKTVHAAMVKGFGTRDLCDNGLTTEQFVDYIAKGLEGLASPESESPPARRRRSSVIPKVDQTVDLDAMRSMFNNLDTDGSGHIDFEEFVTGLTRLGCQPKRYGFGGDSDSEKGDLV